MAFVKKKALQGNYLVDQRKVIACDANIITRYCVRRGVKLKLPGLLRLLCRLWAVVGTALLVICRMQTCNCHIFAVNLVIITVVG